MTHLLVLPILIPLGTGILLLLLRVNPLGRRVVIGFSGLSILVTDIVLLTSIYQNGIHSYRVGGWSAPFGIVMVGDLLSGIMLMLASVIALSALSYSFGYLKTDAQQALFHPLFFFLWTGTNGAFLTGDIFNLFVMFEVMLMSIYALLVMLGEKKQIEAGFKLVTMGLFTSALFLAAAGGIYAFAGTLNMADLALKIKPHVDHPLVSAIAMLFIGVFGLKAAMMPFHFWLPDVHSAAPTPISAMLSGILIKVGVYAIIRVFCLIFVDLQGYFQGFILTMACITMFVGALGAVAQTDLKRLLAYSSISQIGYILMGVGFFTVGGMSAALFYIISHGVIKSSLFLAAGILKKMRGSTEMSDHGDMINTSPAFTIIFFIGVISLGGIPPSGGFFMKFQLIKAGLDGAFYIPVIVAFIVSLMTLFYLFRSWQKICLSGPPQGSPLATPSVKLLIPVGILAMLCLALGLAASPVSALTQAAAEQLFSPELYIRAVMGSM
ncbi:MAG: proton-conducting transporter membrane subunit [Nitrospira sp.]|nr:Na+/H+ antiporter subunit D [Candidatus Manganitrophaceae bacterium]HIL34249.1 Na+/H+ antiporter subunit D [Candidatus Manganitrophaceae bacterium]